MEHKTLKPVGPPARQDPLALALELSGLLLRAPPGAVPGVFVQALGRIGAFLDADRCHATRVTPAPNGPEVTEVACWCAEPTPPGAPSCASPCTSWAAALRAGLRIESVLRIDDRAALPDTAAERRLLARHRNRALLAVPIASHGARLGVLAVESRQPRAFAQADIQLLEAVADAIGAVLACAEATAQRGAEHDRLRTTLGALHELVLEVDADGRYLEVHTADPGQMMVPPDQLIGRTHEEVMPPAIAALNRRAMAEVDAAGRSGPHPFWADTPRGQRRYAMTATPRPPHRPGAAPGYVFVSRDVTDEWHLTRKAERLGRIAERMTDFVIIIDADDRIEWVNPAFEARTGWTLAEVRGRKPSEILHAPDTDRAAVARIYEAMRQGQPTRAELLNRTRTGEEFWTDIDIQPLRECDGTLSGFVCVETDITEQKAHAAALERLAAEATEARTRLELAVDALPDAFAYFDAQERLVLCNAHFRALYPSAEAVLQPGVTFEALVDATVRGGDIPDALGQEDAWIADRVTQFRRGNQSIERQQAGRWMRINDRVTADGGRVCMRIDITALKDAERRLAEIIDAAAAGTWELDLDTGIKRVNDRWAAMLGYTREELATRPAHGFRDLIHPGDLARLLVQQDTLLALGEDRFANEIRMRHKAGHWVWLLSRGRVTARAPDGAPRKVAGIHLDITDRVQLETQLTEERDYLARLMDTSASGITALDGDGRILFANREAERILGVSASGITARRHDDPQWQIRALDGGPMPPEALPYPRVLAEGRTVRDVRFAICWPDGTRRLLSVNAAPFTAEGMAVRVVCSITDITDQVATEAALRSTADRAEAANRAKSRFLANMSHEIWTPLNGVLGMAQVLEDALSDPHHRDMLATIRASGETLLGILNDVLDMSKIEAGKLALEQRRFVPAELADGVRAMHALRAAEKGLSFELTCDEGARSPRLGDPGRLAQVLHNLIGNAIKFTERGSVRVSVRAAPDGALSLRVQDTGIGMTPEQISRVFDEFEQADGTVTRRFGGTGLGMSIVRHLVALMDGAITVDSTPDQGTEIAVRLPLPLASEAAEPATPPTRSRPLAGLRVLAADDNGTNRKILESILIGLGAEVTLVADGRASVDAWDAGRFDIYLLDISMPVLDGISALRALRRCESAAGQPPVPAIAVTANVLAHQVAEYLEAGFGAHVAKPFRREDLAETVLKLAYPAR